MGITEALEIDGLSIKDYAMMPQQEILKRAQMGRIDPSMVAVILSEKAQMAQAAANAKALAQQRPVQSVTENNMQINAQADAEAMVPQQVAGIESLPIREDMFDERVYAGGGIVAFEDGGSVPRFQSQGMVPTFGRQDVAGQGITEPLPGESYFDYLKRRTMASIRGPMFSEQGRAGLSEAQYDALNKARANQVTFSDLLSGKAPIPVRSADETLMREATPPGYYADELTRGSARRAALGGPGRSAEEFGVGASEAAAVRAAADAAAKKRPSKAAEAAAEEPKEDAMARRKRLLKEAGVAEDPFAEDRAANEALRAELGKEREQLRNMSLLEAGLSIMGGSSPYALQNLAEAKGAIGSYAKGMRAIKEDQKEYAKIDRDLRKAADALKRGDVDKALEYEEKAEDRKLKLRQVVASEQAARKPSTVEEYYRLQKAADAGDKSAQNVLKGMFGTAKLGLVDERFLRERWDKMDKLQKLRLAQQGIGFEQWAASEGYPVGGAARFQGFSSRPLGQ